MCIIGVDLGRREDYHDRIRSCEGNSGSIFVPGVDRVTADRRMQDNKD
jgi:hypothetical protein